eukprot:GGOE01037546.1.p1 GENE.GGOE01037546.1~~GGOE01037546.1.p1  ORF type:complete len:411 (+),score=75.70 GGOE01037546.1:113-1234(+)
MSKAGITPRPNKAGSGLGTGTGSSFPSTATLPGCVGTGECCPALRRALHRARCGCHPDHMHCTCWPSGGLTLPRPPLSLAEYWAAPKLPPGQYLHAQAFRAAADADCLDPTLNQLANWSIVFCDPNHLPRLIARLPTLRTPFFLLTHLRDMAVSLHNADVRALLAAPQVVRWFAVNVDCQHPKVVPIPLGVNRAAAEEVFNVSQFMDRLQPTALAYTLFGIGANQRCRPGSPRSACARRKILAQLELNRVSQLPEKVLQRIRAGIDIKVPRREYLERQLSSRFIISPPGNGIDCFRTWESLYLGRVPVVLANNMTVLYRNLPVVVVRDWAALTPKTLQAQWDALATKRFDWSRLTSEWWWLQLMGHCNSVAVS